MNTSNLKALTEGESGHILLFKLKTMRPILITLHCVKLNITTAKPKCKPPVPGHHNKYTKAGHHSSP